MVEVAEGRRVDERGRGIPEPLRIVLVRPGEVSIPTGEVRFAEPPEKLLWENQSTCIGIVFYNRREKKACGGHIPFGPKAYYARFVQYMIGEMKGAGMYASDLEVSVIKNFDPVGNCERVAEAAAEFGYRPRTLTSNGRFVFDPAAGA